MADTQLDETTIDALHGEMTAGRLSAREVVAAYLDRIEAVSRSGPALNAVLAVNERALDRAEELDDALRREGGLTGPLHGIPVLVKDCVETSEVATTFGSAGIEGYVPREDAVCVAKLRAAGAIVLAKTTLPDWATSWFSYSSVSGDTRNPYALDHDPGGSSAGTGAAVAANLGAVGIGTDCGGSIRLPSSFTNLVGVRSTPGVVPRTGSSYLVIFQDTIGPMTRTVADAATVFDAIAGYDSSDPYTAAYAVARAPRSYRETLGREAEALHGATLGLVTNALGAGEDAAPVNRVVEAAVAALRDAGAEVVEVEIPGLAGHIEATSQYVARTKHDIDEFLAARPELAGTTLERLVEAGTYHPQLDLIDAVMAGPDEPEEDPDYFRRFAAREAFTRALVNVMVGAGAQALVYPTVQVPPPSHEGRAAWTTLTFPTNTLIASQTWTPAISVPAGFTDDGLPVGLEVVAKPYDEPTAFRLAHAFEQATGHRRAPEL